MPDVTDDREVLSREAEAVLAPPAGGAHFRWGSPKVALVGTYPPTKCGIATFNASLRHALIAARPGLQVGIVACTEPDAVTLHPREVIAQLVSGSVSARADAVAALADFDAVLVQHEFGIYGGADGSEVLDVVGGLDVPVIVVLHTVPLRPTFGQRAVIEQLSAEARRVVVQSTAARDRLVERYAVASENLVVIPHGARLNLANGRAQPGRRAQIVLTWGLLGPDKGIEWGIDAIARLRHFDPAPRYVVLGQTHPRILEAAGEAYRDSLVERAAALGVSDLVEFDNAYHDTPSLLARVRGADIVLLPYRSRDQVVSGVLVEALASGKPVVATGFPHAVELLDEGSGLIVPHENAEAIADALRAYLTEPALAARAAVIARRQAQGLRWEAVAESYLTLVAEVAGRSVAPRRRFPAPPFEHLLRLSDDAGIFEHAELTLPRREHGYCTDDVARALVALLREPERTPGQDELAATLLGFLEHAQVPDGRFHNRLSVDRRWLDTVGSDDATGRALWAAGVAASVASDSDQRVRALQLFERGAGFRTPWPRAYAYVILGAVEVLAMPSRRPAAAAYALLERAASGLARPSDDAKWPWPETRLSYANAVLAEARLAAGAALDEEGLLREGLDLLAWLVEIERSGDHFSFTPVGGWAPGEPRPGFDQQPIEASAMADACARALDLTGDPQWADHLLHAAAWFLGENDVGVSLFDPSTGGCRDGLTSVGANENQGAESTIALVTALQHTRRLQAAAERASRISAASIVAAPMQRSAAPYVR